jgi:hypothetical protein
MAVDNFLQSGTFNSGGKWASVKNRYLGLRIVVNHERHYSWARMSVTRGEDRQFTAKQAKCFEVYESRAIHVAPNDKLLLTANRREPGFRATNGELVTVSRIDEQGRIHLQDGRSLPENYK